MRIRDKAAFLPLKYKIKITDNDGEIATFTISLNFSVRLFYELLTYCEALDDENTDINDKAEYLIKLFCDLISLDPNADKVSKEWYYVKIRNILDDKKRSTSEKIECLMKTFYSINPSARTIINEWACENISVTEMLKVISDIYVKLNEVLSGDEFSIPDIDVKRKPTQGKQSDAEKERQIKRAEIEKLNKILSQCGTHLTDEITMMIENTSCSYTEIMNMPILMYKAILRSVYMGKIRADDDYNLTYLQKEINKPENKEMIIRNAQKNAMNNPPNIADVKAISKFANE